MTDIVFPKWGMGIDEGTVVRWLKREGEAVALGDPIVEIETAKATQEIEAPASGRLVRISVKAGDTVAVNESLGEIADG